MHEILHVALQHMTRLNGRNPSLWNRAADFVVNLMLKLKGYMLPDGGALDHKYKGMNTEQVYKSIYQKEKDKGNDPDNATFSLSGFGADLDYAPDEDAKDIEKEVTDIVMRAATHAKAQNQIGSVPGEILVELEKRVNPKLPWHVIFRNYLQNFVKDDYTWKRPNRRYMPEFYLPSAYSESLVKFAAAVDSSYSVENHEFTFFVTELDTVKDMYHPDEFLVIDFDTKIKHVHTITPEMNIAKDIKFKGRGGTDIEPLMQWAEENDPTVLIVFTDGEFYLPETKPKCPVIWLIHGDYNFKPEFGTVIRYDI
jgi:predicted metal-dependent peptidase